MIYRILWVALFGLLPFSLSLAQKYDSHWTFGDSAGIDFSDTTNPRPFKSHCRPSISSAQTQATISDENGKLIAYWTYDTLDQRPIYGRLINKYGQPIKNGDSILSYPVFANGAVFVPIPNDKTRYYFFNISPMKGDQKTSCRKIGCTISYAVLQVFSDERIEVLQKNQILLEGEFSNYLGVIRHANGRDWWLLAHESTSNRFIRFIITPNGITNPTYQAIGRGPTSFELKKEFYYWLGEMTFSPKGNWLCIGASGLDLLELYRFNRCNGLLSDLVVLGPDKKISYDFYNTYGYAGVSFSPDESKLYVSRVEDPPFVTTDRYFKIFQYDINALLKNKKYEHLIIYDETNNNIPYLGSHELGPDNKIYIAVMNENSTAPDIRTRLSPYLFRINKPNEPYPACDFQEKGFFSRGGTFYGRLTQFSCLSGTDLTHSDRAH